MEQGLEAGEYGKGKAVSQKNGWRHTTLPSVPGLEDVRSSNDMSAKWRKLLADYSRTMTTWHEGRRAEAAKEEAKTGEDVEITAETELELVITTHGRVM